MDKWENLLKVKPKQNLLFKKPEFLHPTRFRKAEARKLNRVWTLIRNIYHSAPPLPWFLGVAQNWLHSSWAVYPIPSLIQCARCRIGQEGPVGKWNLPRGGMPRCLHTRFTSLIPFRVYHNHIGSIFLFCRIDTLFYLNFPNRPKLMSRNDTSKIIWEWGNLKAQILNAHCYGVENTAKEASLPSHFCQWIN